MTRLSDARSFCSWSGGKDSALALYRMREVADVQVLLTMMIEDGSRSRSHGLRREVIEAQGRALQIPVRLVSTSWQTYEAKFVSCLQRLRREGFSAGIYGDIDIDAHRTWVEGVSATSGIAAMQPLWHQDRVTLLEEFFESGFRARIVAIKSAVLPGILLGKELTPALVERIKSYGADISGENGEYHTVTFDGPLFKSPLELVCGRTVVRDGYRFLDLAIA